MRTTHSRSADDFSPSAQRWGGHALDLGLVALLGLCLIALVCAG